MWGKVYKGYTYAVAGSICVVEGLKEQGVARCLNNSLKNKLTPSVVAAGPDSDASAEVTQKIRQGQRQTEDCVSKVMELSCWGPSTTRF